MKTTLFVLSILLFITVFSLAFKACKERAREATYCGVVVGKTTEESIHKHHVSNHEYIFFRTDAGEILTISPTLYTYYKLKAGDRTCWSLSKEDYNKYSGRGVYNLWWEIGVMLSFFSILFAALYKWAD